MCTCRAHRNEAGRVYNLFTGGKRQSFDYYKMRQALYDGEAEGLFDRIVVSHPTWPVTDALSTWGATSIQQSYDWFLYVRMALDAGYYGLAMVDFRKCGLFGQGPDHWVLLCGAREVFDATKKCTNWEVMVSCSAKASPDEEWVGVGDFLKDRGGFNLFLARPSAK